VRIIIEADADQAAETAANLIAQQVQTKPDSVLGLATGGTPIRCYQSLIRRYREGTLDFGQVRTFNLDEYIGLPLDHPESYHSFMDAQLFSHINVPRQHRNLPDPTGNDYSRQCQEYEDRIDRAGGIDLQLLGIGRDGHIGFNEPGSSLASRTRVKHLTQETIDDNARFFDDAAEVPRLAITMGVGTILQSRRCLLLATGDSKAVAIRDAVEGPLTASVPASALQLHRDTIVVVDEAAASLLQRHEYYRMSETAARQLAAETE
jgi:glucosamine-6-phosphate deaminase